MIVQPLDNGPDGRYAKQREERLGEVPGWIAVHRTIGHEQSPDVGCTCRRSWSCDRPGKHPVASRFPHGSRDAVRLEEVRGWLVDEDGQGIGRLAAVLAADVGERVLDADSDRGMATLWRCADEVSRSWLGVRTPRGLHVWQFDVPLRGQEPNGYLDRKRCIVPHGLDVKTSGFVIWPDGRDRWAVDTAEVLRRRYPGVEPGDRLVEGPDPMKVRLTGRSPDGEEQYALVASAGLWGREDPSTAAVELHEDALRSIKTYVGDRNNALNMAGWRCRALIAYAGWGIGEVADSLYRAGIEAGLGEGETERTVRSGLGVSSREWRSRA